MLHTVFSPSKAFDFGDLGHGPWRQVTLAQLQDALETLMQDINARGGTGKVRSFRGGGIEHDDIHKMYVYVYIYIFMDINGL